MRVRKFYSRIIVTVLIIAMSVVMLPCAAFADPAREYNYYVALGDSVTAGGALDGYYRGVQGFLPGAYPSLVKERIGCSDGFAGGLCGIRTYELLMLLDDSFGGDDYTNNFFSTERWGYPLTTGYLTDPVNRARYRDAIAKADLITINMGNNDIYGNYTYFGDRHLAGMSTLTPAEQRAKAAIDKAIESGFAPDSVNELVNAYGELSYYANLLSELTKAVSEFKVNWEKIMDYIYTNNPDVDVVVIGLYNPSSAFADIFFNDENNFMKYGSRYAQRYEYVDISELGEKVANGESPDNGAHPDYNGHKLIADKVCNALAGFKHCDHCNTCVIGKTGTLLGTLSYSGDVYCKDCGRLIQQGQFLDCKDSVIPVARNIFPTMLDSLRNVMTSFFNKFGRGFFC